MCSAGTCCVRLSSKNVAATDRAAEAADDKAASAALATDANQDDMGETIVVMICNRCNSFGMEHLIR